jgi:hypothetical protein
MQDADGHWSHWSDPVQFTSGEALPSDLAGALRISELHYHPANPTEVEKKAGFVDADDFEFMELVNIGSQTIRLSETSLTKVDVDGNKEGVNFDFSTGEITELAPGERLLVVENPEAFALRYGEGLPVAGKWGGKLSNGGERLTLVDNGAVILEFAYDDAWHLATDGEGFSLEALDPRATDRHVWAQPEGWVPSVDVGGSPGASRIGGDFDGDLVVTARDIDMLFGAIRDPPPAPRYDLSNDHRVDADDVDVLIQNVLNTFYGDTDLNGEVSFVDFLALSGSFGQSNRSWSQGDFTGDGEVSFADFLILSENFGRMQTAL